MTDPNPAITPPAADAPSRDAGFSLRCGDVEIDRPTRRLRRQSQALALGSRAFDLLLALIDGRADVQGAEALRAAVWPDRTVGDNNLRVQMTHLRRLLGEQTIQHRPGRGYQLLAPVHEAAPASLPPPPPSRPGNLPEAAWPVLGRAELLAQLARHLQPGERPTLAGLGGAGKTVLALAAAEQAAAGFADGAWWVDLAPLRDSAQLPNAVATALQRPVAREAAMERLAHSLSGQRMLLVLDNCEHLRAAVAELSDRLLRTAPGITLLATSRVPLRSAGERLIAVPPLSLPDAAGSRAGADGSTDWAAASASGAVAVFEARARAADPRFRVTPANAATVVEICRRLDGHALALTLAAARVPVLGLNALRDGLDERLRWAHRETPGTAPQHLSLQGALDWTWDLLSAAEQRLLRRLGVFTGRFSLAAAAAVCGDDRAALLRPLESLVAHGLVGIDSAGLLGAGDMSALHTLHESTRLYAHERLLAAGEADEACAALGRHLLNETHRSNHRAATPAPVMRAWRNLLPDAQAVVEWATMADPHLALALCGQMVDVWRQAGQHVLVRRLAAPLLAQPVTEALAGARTTLLVNLCIVDYEVEDTDGVLARTAEALRQLDGRDDESAWLQRGLALSWQANVHARREQLVLAETLYRDTLALFRRAGNAWREGESLRNLGWALQSQGKFGTARPVLQEALALSIRDGDDWAQMVSHENLGELEMALGAHAAAAAHFERATLLGRRAPDTFRTACALVFLGLACAAMGECARARAATREALQISIRHEFVRLQADACSALAATLAHMGRAVRAHAALCAARHWRDRHGFSSGSLFDRTDADTERQTRAVLNDADCRMAQAQGELLTLGEAMAWAAEDHTADRRVAAR